jgi:predicted dehydrogenase
MKRILGFLAVGLLLPAVHALAQQPAAGDAKPLRLGVVGLTHDHVHGILGRTGRGDFEIVGIAEPNQELARRYLKRYKLPESLWFPTIGAMVEKTRPEAVCAFNSIAEHRGVVEYCAPRGIHVMVEKPLAFSLDDARAMEKLATGNKIHLLTNYETTWYPTHRQLYDMVHRQHAVGEVRKVVVHDGHPGPKEIGCSNEFLAWLTDPNLNGGGAVIDFGCYGADLMTWLMNGQRPQSVTAVTQTIKPDVYPRVDDEATIIVTYPTAQAIFQASWNWPVSRKDMEVYGQSGYLIADNSSQLRYRKDEKSAEEKMTSPALPAPENDPFSYFAAVVRGKVEPKNDLSSLPVNMVVVEILDAAVRSAKEGKTIELK